MNSGSWAAYRAAMPLEAFGEPDDDPPPTPKQIANAPPEALVVSWLVSVSYPEDVTLFDPETETYHTETILRHDRARTFRVFGAESWRFKHAKAWCEAMERRYGKGNAWIEEAF